MKEQSDAALQYTFNRLSAARQDYDLAKQEVDQILKSRCIWDDENKERFRAAVERREKARERWLQAMKA